MSHQPRWLSHTHTAPYSPQTSSIGGSVGAGFDAHTSESVPIPYMCVSVCVWVFTGSLPEDALMALASGPWGVEYKLLALCSAAVVLQIWVK